MASGTNPKRLLLAILLGLLLPLALSVRSLPTAAERATPRPPRAAAVAPWTGDLRFACTWRPPGAERPRSQSFPDAPLLAVQPKDTTRVRVLSGIRRLRVRLALFAERLPGCSARVSADGELFLTVPEAPGVHIINLRVPVGQTEVRTSLCLVVPGRSPLAGKMSGELTLGGTSMGSYSDPRKSGAEKVRANLEAYTPPEHFLRITKETGAYFVSPSLRLRDLVVPGEDSGTRHTDWVPLRYELLDLIEMLRAGLAAQGKSPDALTPISLFRTPRYNRAIGSGRYSRHPYGDAMDFIIDADGDGRMDDLTGDGRSDRSDGLWLVALIEDLQADGQIAMGGIGVYTFTTGDHTVTMHVDCRGHRATWAYHYDRRGRKGAFEWKSRRFAEYDEAQKRRRAARAAGKKSP